MAGWIALTIILFLYGLFCLVVGALKSPPAVWNMAKIEAFKKMLGEKGTQVFLALWGLAAIAGGVVVLVLKVIQSS